MYPTDINNPFSAPHQGQLPSPAFPQIFNSPSPPFQPPAVLPMVPAEALCYLKDTNERNLHLAVENERLKHKQHMEKLKEEAYTKAFGCDNRTWTITESGRPVEVLDADLTAAFQLIPQGPEEHPVTYGLGFTGHKELILFNEADYLDDKRLIHSLQTAGIHVICRRSMRTTAALIRQCISERLVSVITNFYGGWKVEDQGLIFMRFQAFSSHQGQNYLDAAQPLPDVSPTAAAMAVTQLAKLFQTVRSPALRWLLSAWFHASFLFSLLGAAGCALPMGLCFYTREPVIQSWLERLLCWYGDPPINLDDRPAAFNRAMWSRKDQPVVILDRHQTENACRNSVLLEEILATKTIAWKNGRKETILPLQATIVVLCNTSSSLCCSPKLFTLDLQEENFDLELCQKQLEQASVHQDYLQALASYTAAHWSDLQESLRQGRTQAAAFADNADMLAEAGTLLGVASFAGSFFRFCGAENASASLGGDVTLDSLQDVFGQMASNISGIDVPSQFCQLAQRCLADGIFSIQDADKDDLDGTKPVVYLIGEDYGFTTEAFRTVCRRMSQSAPVIAQILSEAGLLRGKRTNATTVQTRIPVTNATGHCRYVGVYRIAQEEIMNELF